MTNIVHDQGVTILELGREYDALDEATFQQARDAVVRAADHAEPPRLLVDMSQTVYISSSFMELLFRAWKRIRQRQGRFAVCCPNAFCDEVLTVSRVDRLFPVLPTRQAGLDMLNRQED